MALKPLNSVAGFSVGETPANIILANGDITTTNITTTGISNLNSIGNVKISGGSSGQVISTDGAGNLSYISIDSAALNNGNSNVRVFANSNVTISVGGTANVATFTSTGMNVAGYVSAGNITANGNVSVNNYIVTPSTVDLIVAPATQITRFYSNVNPFSGGYSLGNSLARWDNVFANTANIAGNVSAGNVLTDHLLYANGQPWDLQEAAGSNNEIQYNDNDNFGASANFTFNPSTNLLTVNGNAQFNNANLGNLAIANFVNVASNTITNNLEVNLEITGNTANFSGNIYALNFVGNISGNLTVPGSNTGVVFNDDGLANSTLGFTFDKTSNAITANGNLTVNNANLGNLAYANFINVSSNLQVTDTANVGNLRTDNLLYANGQPWDLQEAAGSNTQIQYNDGANDFGASANLTYDDATQQFTVLGNAQFNNANLGNLASANFIDITSNLITNNLTVNLELSGNTATFTGNLEAGNLSTSGSGGDITMSGGNITGANVVSANTFTGNTFNVSSLVNGTSNIVINLNGNVNTSVAGTQDVLVVSSTGANIVGFVEANGTISAGAFSGVSLTSNTGNLLLQSEQSGDSYVQILAHGNGVVDVGNFRIQSLAEPNAASDAATKYYVDSVAQGLDPKASVHAASNAAISVSYTYNNGTSGVGATLTASTNGVLVLNGESITLGQRVLIKNEAGAFVNNTTPSAAFNGIYVMTTEGTISVPWVLTRAVDFDVNNEMYGAFVFVETGSGQADTAWVCTNNSATPITIGTTQILWSQFAGGGTYTGSNGISVIGTVISANIDGITTEISGGNIVVKANAQFTTPNIGVAIGTSLDLTGNLLKY